MNTLEQISHETMVFMRGKYRLDEIGDGKNELKTNFRNTYLTTMIILKSTMMENGCLLMLPL